MIEIKTQIEPNPITGLNQEVVIAQIAYMDFDIKEAKIRFDDKVSIIYWYNRALSSEEVLENFEVHKTRFGL